MAESPSSTLPEGIFSLLDTDLYKLTMQCCILKYFPDISVTYSFTNRTPDKKLNRAAFQWLQAQLEHLSLSDDEFQFLKSTCPYLNDEYMTFLSKFRLHPSKQLKLIFSPTEDTGAASDFGDFRIHTEGLWLDTILYEIPLLALVSEAYFKFCDKDWSYAGQEEKAYQKGLRLLEEGCIFSEFGTRRRRDHHTQELVLRGLRRAQAEAAQKGWAGKLTGTSNVHFAMKHDVSPIGTVAHEWFMGVAAITNDYEHANEIGLEYWTSTFGEGVLAIALTDTFGTPAFLKAFKQPVHKTNKTSKTYADVFTGVRQDSGDPLDFVRTMRQFYDEQGVKEKKTIVFSDSLNIDLCLKYKAAAELQGFQPTFGVGTYLTNDYVSEATGNKSVPLNIVIKIASASGRHAVKISDNIGKNTGDQDTVSEVKQRLGYTEKTWIGGNEGTRWGTGTAS
ncbi:nicotinate phosphoribosyltransferase [Massarina eburnea CBS 473.64]|uniref:Nicotinate phosphoribosyltransferase n=1 Tax=Massarina eburnea CBS 473.64 TaxID=1395130 RepID=A0A6A6S5K1_9PLEO|nr:nicotinate phosphoribosyltransferase [Massarina eburnea CBS 473.64]